MNTQENNKLIAEFMRWDIKSLTTMPPNLHLSNLQLDNGDIMELKFHESWDWLMPVVEKIKNVGFAPDKMYNEKSIDYILTNNFSKTNLYHAVVEFIKSHNHIIERDKKRLG